MTSNQIAFNNYLEVARHNAVSEGIERHKAESSRMSAEASEKSATAATYQARVAGARQLEDARHNVQDEAIRQGQLHVQGEQTKIARDKQLEEARHNAIAESISRQQVQSSREVGLTQAAVNREVGLSQASASHAQAGAAMQQAQIAALRQVEDARHNMVSEGISQIQAHSGLIQAGAAKQNAIASTLRAQGTIISASASQKSAEAALKQAVTAEGLSKSKKFSNYASGFNSVSQGGSMLAKTILGVFK